MVYLEIFISFVIGALLVALTGRVFSLKTKGLVRLLINSVAGGVLLVGLSLFHVVYLPLNPLNAFITGLLGLPGLIVVWLVVVFL